MARKASVRSQVSRPPRFPRREDILEQERAAYDTVGNLVAALISGPVEEDAFASACLNAPSFAAALWGLKRLVLATAERGNSYSHRDRALIDVVVAFDSGHYGVLEGHLQWSVQCAGMDVGTLEALWNGREAELPEEDRHLVEYVRAVVDRTVSDDLFSQTSTRFGSPRGAVEYTIAIGYTRLINQLMRALGVPSISRNEMQTTIGRLRDGTTQARDDSDYERALREFAENPSVPPWVLDRTLPLYVVRR